jgi:hypothetical protein
MTAAADPVRPVGRAIPVDARGCVVNPCTREQIAEPWLGAVHTALALIRMALDASLHSVYLRGSVPRGTAVAHLSDLDLVCVLSSPPPPQSRSSFSTIDARIRQHHPFCAGADLRVVSREQLMEPGRSATLRFLLKTQAICIQGEDLTTLWEDIPLAQAKIALRALPASLAAVRAFMHAHPDGETDERARLCRWVAKKIIRAGFELVAERECAYTRDLYPCWEAWSRHHPERAHDMYQTLLLALEPRQPAKTITEALQLGDWVVATASPRVTSPIV